MSTSKERVISALNFLTGEGIDYYPNGCNDNAIEALINDYFKAVAIDTNSLVALRATKLLLTPTQSRDYILLTAQYRKSRASLLSIIMRWRCITLKRV